MNKEDYYGRPGGEQLDCVVRAFTVLTEKPYAEVHKAFKDAGRKDGRKTHHHITRMVAKKFKLTRTTSKMTVRKFLDDVQSIPRLAAFIHGHAFGVTNGVIADYEKVKPRAIVKCYYTK